MSQKRKILTAAKVRKIRAYKEAHPLTSYAALAKRFKLSNASHAWFICARQIFKGVK